MNNSVKVPSNILKEKWNIEKQCWEESITEEEKLFLYKKEIEKLKNIYIVEKMKIENVFNDFMSYMDEKNIYDEQVEVEQQTKYEAYKLLLKENPDLTYEEFEREHKDSIVKNLSLLEKLKEPEIPESVKQFMEKYL